MPPGVTPIQGAIQSGSASSAPYAPQPPSHYTSQNQPSNGAMNYNSGHHGNTNNYRPSGPAPTTGKKCLIKVTSEEEEVDTTITMGVTGTVRLLACKPLVASLAIIRPQVTTTTVPISQPQRPPLTPMLPHLQALQIPLTWEIRATMGRGILLREVGSHRTEDTPRTIWGEDKTRDE